MQYTTKIKFANALEECLQNTRISQVTVSNIVAVSGLSRQTFYNNFIDIYDLIYWMHTMWIKEVVDTFWKEEDFCQAFEGAAAIMRKHKKFYRQIIWSEGVNSFQKSFYRQNVELSKERIRRVCASEINESIAFLLHLYWSGASQMLVNWIIDDMKMEPAELADLLYEGLPLMLSQYWPERRK